MKTELELKLPPNRDAPRNARHALDRLADDVPKEILENLRLLVSELVTNCVRHAGLGEEGWIELTVGKDGPSIRVEVVDPGDGFEPTPAAVTMYSTSGWGLYLVAQLADRWGVTVDRGTKVWFELRAA
ncbi:MAG TPA: ATP-binding protein [Actinomycetota bacterium]